MIEEFKKKIIEDIEKINIDGPSQLNAFGMKILILDIIKKAKSV